MTIITQDRPIVVIGKSGQVAEALVRRAHDHGVALVAGGREDADLRDLERLKSFVLANRPSVVINAAAYTAVDQAEREPDDALALNGEAPARLAALCAFAGVPLIHVSTDFVFSGLTDRPYQPQDQPQPLGVYGASKAAGEVGVRVTHPQHVIVRSSWIYGRASKNFVKTMLRLGRDKGEVGVVADQIGAPTFADDLADALILMAQRISDSEDAALYGTFHFANAGQTTWCDFANAIFATAGDATGAGQPIARAKPIRTVDYPTPARRPPYSVLDVSATTQVYGITPRAWKDALADAMPAILAAEA